MVTEMSDDPREQPRARRLDDQSRQAVGRFLGRLGSLSAVAAFWMCMVPAMAPWRAGTLAMAYALGAMFAVTAAATRGEGLARGSLNGWDEALAFAALSRLAHLAQGLHP